MEISTDATAGTPADWHGPRPRPARFDDRHSSFDAPAARRFLEALSAPRAGCIELRVLRAAFDRQGRVCRGDDSGGGFGGGTLAGWFDNAEPLLKEAHRLRGVSGYVTFNPVRLDLLARSDNRLSRARHTTRDADILCLRWLYLDIDPVRPPKSAAPTSSWPPRSSDETRSWATIPSSRPPAPGAVQATGPGPWSGSPTIPTTRTIPRFCPGPSRPLTRSIATPSSGSTRPRRTPSRLIGLPGTLKAKGCNRPERPWRRVTLDGMGTKTGLITKSANEPPWLSSDRVQRGFFRLRMQSLR